MVMDSVPGDAILAGGNLSFSGATGGDYLGAGGNEAISGRIHGSLRAAGGAIRVAATVDRNATITGGKVDLDSAAVIGRSAYLFAGAIQVDGAVRGTLLAAGGTVTLNGVVGANVEVAADQLRIGPHAQIVGNLRYKVPAGKVHIDPGARIGYAGPREPTLTINNVLGIMRACQRGIGVALLPDYLVEENGGLVQLFGGDDALALDAYFVYPEELKSVARVQVFRDFLVAMAQRWRY